MKKLLLLWSLIFVSTAFFFEPLIAHANQCECPTVSAVGEGNSSCSASEANGECTIDFNLFAERETRARNFILDNSMLVSFGSEIIFPPENFNTFDGLSFAINNGDDAVTSTIFLYLMVALSKNGSDSSGSVIEVAKSMGSTVRDLKDDIVFAFQPIEGRFPLGDGNSRRFNTNGLEIVLAIGCIEMRSGNIWAMFKTFWSPLRNQPRCGG